MMDAKILIAPLGYVFVATAAMLVVLMMALNHTGGFCARKRNDNRGI